MAALAPIQRRCSSAHAQPDLPMLCAVPTLTNAWSTSVKTERASMVSQITHVIVLEAGQDGFVILILTNAFTSHARTEEHVLKLPSQEGTLASVRKNLRVKTAKNSRSRLAPTTLVKMEPLAEMLEVSSELFCSLFLPDGMLDAHAHFFLIIS